MGTKFIISFIKIAATILFYFLAIVTVVVIFKSIMILFFNEGSSLQMVQDNDYSLKVIDIHFNENKSPFTYSKDSLMRYQQMNNQYSVQVLPQSLLGYYLTVTKLLFLTMGMLVLWNFKKIFGAINLAQPYNNSIVRRLKILAALFVISDLLKFINYFTFNSYMRQSFSPLKFDAITESGDGIITGLIIWVIAIIYERGIVLQEENALTV